jgi:hypothetical protein
MLITLLQHLGVPAAVAIPVGIAAMVLRRGAGGNRRSERHDRRRRS